MTEAVQSLEVDGISVGDDITRVTVYETAAFLP